MAAMRTLPALLAACFVLLFAAGSVEAQKPGERNPRASELATGRASARQAQRDVGDTERALPYLAYTMGELHYLDTACEGLDAQAWRQRMIELLAMEAAEVGRQRDRLIESFNDGYRSQQRRRPICGEEVDIERRALAHRGRDLSEMMRAAYFD